MPHACDGAMSSSLPCRRPMQALFHAPLRELGGDVALDGLRLGDVAAASLLVPLALLGEAEAVEGTRHLAIELQGRLVVRNRLVDAFEPKVDEAAAAQLGRILRCQLYRLIAV